MRELWYQPKNQGYPRKVVTKPYNDYLYGRLVFMPRHIKPCKAAMIVIRRISREPDNV